jgi:hypothetical protein
MEDGAVVPDVNRLNLPVAGDVCDQPVHSACVVTQTLSRPVQRRARDVEHRDAFRAAREQVIHEAGIPAPNIDDSRTGIEASSVDES